MRHFPYFKIMQNSAKHAFCYLQPQALTVKPKSHPHTAIVKPARFPRNVQNFCKCASFSQKRGCNCGNCGHLSEISIAFLLCRKKLTKPSQMKLSDCTESGAEIAVFFVFGGGKLYSGTANRRKQSTGDFEKEKK